MRHSCKWKNNIFIDSVLCTILLASVQGSLGNEGHENTVGGVTPRISILIGGSESNVGTGAENKNGPIGVMNDENSWGSNDPGARSESSTRTLCSRVGSGASCCYQFTWPGYQETIPRDAPSNATCKYLKEHREDDTIPCFDPIVYTEIPEGAEDHSRGPPDFEELTTKSRLNQWNIYCMMADKACVTLTHYARGSGNRIANQTRFCGVVTNSNNGNRIEKGCYRQKTLDGYVREVCVCKDRSLCNDRATISTVSSSLSIFAVVLISILSYIQTC